MSLGMWLLTQRFLHLISGVRRNVDEICALLGCSAASSGNPLPTFRDNVLVLYSGVKKSGLLDPMASWPLKMGLTCSETSAKDYHSVLRNTPEKRRRQGFCSSQASCSGLFSKSNIRFLTCPSYIQSHSCPTSEHPDYYYCLPNYTASYPRKQ
jgi:hypothetical protein